MYTQKVKFEVQREIQRDRKTKRDTKTKNMELLPRGMWILLENEKALGVSPPWCEYNEYC